MNKDTLTIRLEKKSVLMIAAACLVLFLLIHYWAAVASVIGALSQGLVPILLGFMIAYLVNICMRFYERLLLGSKKRYSSVRKKYACCWLF